MAMVHFDFIHRRAAKGAERFFSFCFAVRGRKAKNFNPAEVSIILLKIMSFYIYSCLQKRLNFSFAVLSTAKEKIIISALSASRAQWAVK
jgi:hypothetical protein